MQDEVREKSVAFVIRVGKGGAKMTEELLRSAIRKYLEHAKEPPHGKQSVRSLVRQDAGVQNIEITDRNIRPFERVARRYGVDFALKKDPAQGRYLVFFKARDADALTAAFREYTAKTLGRGKGKPSVMAQLVRFKEAVQGPGMEKVKKRGKGGHEL